MGTAGSLAHATPFVPPMFMCVRFLFCLCFMLPEHMPWPLWASPLLVFLVDHHPCYHPVGFHPSCQQGVDEAQAEVVLGSNSIHLKSSQNTELDFILRKAHLRRTQAGPGRTV